jgi:hypothetical protein
MYISVSSEGLGKFTSSSSAKLGNPLAQAQSPLQPHGCSVIASVVVGIQAQFNGSNSVDSYFENVSALGVLLLFVGWLPYHISVHLNQIQSRRRRRQYVSPKHLSKTITLNCVQTQKTITIWPATDAQPKHFSVYRPLRHRPMVEWMYNSMQSKCRH